MFTSPFRSSGALQRAVYDMLERRAQRALPRNARGLTCNLLTLSDDVEPRPHAGRNSRRTHARVWR